MQECHGLSWNLQTFYSTGEDKVKWALCYINNYANESHSTFSSWSCPRYNSNKRKRNSEQHTEIFFGAFWFSWKKENKREKQKREKLFTRESSQQVIEEQGNLFGFYF